MAGIGRLDNTREVRSTFPVRFFGLLDHEIAEVVEFYTTEAAAERDLELILEDEPDWLFKLEIVEVDFGGPEIEVRPMARR